MKNFKKLFITLSICAISAISAIGFVGCGIGNWFETCEHEWEIVEVTKEATCSEEGEKLVVCTLCEKEEKQAIEKAAHIEVETEIVLPECDKPGKTEGVICSICEAVLVEPQELPALGHVEVVDAAVAATCTKKGLSEGTHCQTCNEVLTAQEEVPALGHDIFLLKGKEATCLEEGMTNGQACRTCGTIYVAQQSIPKRNHTLDENMECTICGYFDGNAYLALFAKAVNVTETAAVDNQEYAVGTVIRIYRSASQYGYNCVSVGSTPYLAAYDYTNESYTGDNYKNAAFFSALSGKDTTTETITGDIFYAIYDEYVDFYIGNGTVLQTSSEVETTHFFTVTGDTFVLKSMFDSIGNVKILTLNA